MDTKHYYQVHQGYVDGINGTNPDVDLSRNPDSEYNRGWIEGDLARSEGKVFRTPEVLPVRGQEVTIPKGTMVKNLKTGETKPTGRTYKVKIHDAHPLIPAYLYYGDIQF